MYKINDTVLYGAQGVCRISGTTTKSFNGGKMEYYVLKPCYSANSTIYVPMHNEALLKKMRRLLSAEEIHQIIRTMPAQASSWIEDESERRTAYRDILSHGDRMELLRMIKALYLHQQLQQEKGRRLHASDETFFKEAEKMLYDEFALVLHIQPADVLPFILDQLSTAEKDWVH